MEDSSKKFLAALADSVEPVVECLNNGLLPEDVLVEKVSRLLPNGKFSDFEFNVKIDAIVQGRRQNRILSLASLLALERHPEFPNAPALRAKLSGRVGVLFNSVNQATAARKRLQSFIFYFEGLPQTMEIGRELSDAYSHSATSARNLHLFAEALSEFRKARDLAVCSDDPRGAAWQTFKLGKMYLNYLEQSSRGLNYILDARREFSVLTSDDALRGEAACFDEIGNIHRGHTNDIGKACTNYEKAEAIHLRRGNIGGLARTLAHRGLCEQSMKNFAEAERLLTESVNLLEENGPDRRGLGVRKGQLARLLVEVGAFERAELVLEQARMHSIAFRDFKSQANHELTRSEILAARGRIGQAEKAIIHCVEICRKNNLKRLLIEANERLASFVNDEIGDYRRVSDLTLEATKQRLEAWDAISKSGPSLEEVEDKNSIGEMYKSLFQRLLDDYRVNLSRVTRAVSSGYELALEERQERWNDSLRLFRAGAYAAAVAHDILNEINNIGYAIDDLVHDSESHNIQGELLRIKRELIGSVSKLHNAMAIQPKNNTQAASQMNLEAAFANVINDVVSRAEHCEISVSYSEDTFDGNFQCDFYQLLLVTKVICENAGEALANTESACVWIEVSLSDDATNLQINFHDNGPGVPLALEKDIFDFSFSTKPNHLGHGLPAVRVLLNDLGGGIAYRASKFGGACFEVMLPIARTDQLE